MKVISGDVVSLGLTANEILNNHRTMISKLQNELETIIIESKQELKGKAWDSVRNKLSTYSNALKKDSNLGLCLKNACGSANSGMRSFMLPETELDTAILGECRERLHNMYYTLGEVGAAMHNKKATTAQKKGYARTIEYLNGNIEKLKEKIKKLEDLPPKDSALYSALVAAVGSNLAELNNDIDSIPISKM